MTKLTHARLLELSQKPPQLMNALRVSGLVNLQGHKIWRRP